MTHMIPAAGERRLDDHVTRDAHDHSSVVTSSTSTLMILYSSTIRPAVTVMMVTDEPSYS